MPDIREQRFDGVRRRILNRTSTTSALLPPRPVINRQEVVLTHDPIGQQRQPGAVRPTSLLPNSQMWSHFQLLGSVDAVSSTHREIAVIA